MVRGRGVAGRQARQGRAGQPGGDVHNHVLPNSRRSPLPCLRTPAQEVVAAGKWARGPWAGGAADAAAVEEESGAELRCVPLAQPVSTWGGFNTCLYTGYQASEVALFARPLL